MDGKLYYSQVISAKEFFMGEFANGERCWTKEGPDGIATWTPAVMLRVERIGNTILTTPQPFREMNFKPVVFTANSTVWNLETLDVAGETTSMAYLNISSSCSVVQDSDNVYVVDGAFTKPGTSGSPLYQVVGGEMRVCGLHLGSTQLTPAHLVRRTNLPREVKLSVSLLNADRATEHLELTPEGKINSLTKTVLSIFMVDFKTLLLWAIVEEVALLIRFFEAYCTGDVQVRQGWAVEFSDGRWNYFITPDGFDFFVTAYVFYATYKFNRKWMQPLVEWNQKRIERNRVRKYIKQMYLEKGQRRKSSRKDRAYRKQGYLKGEEAAYEQMVDSMDRYIDDIGGGTYEDWYSSMSGSGAVEKMLKANVSPRAVYDQRIALYEQDESSDEEEIEIGRDLAQSRALGAGETTTGREEQAFYGNLESETYMPNIDATGELTFLDSIVPKEKDGVCRLFNHTLETMPGFIGLAMTGFLNTFKDYTAMGKKVDKIGYLVSYANTAKNKRWISFFTFLRDLYAMNSAEIEKLRDVLQNDIDNNNTPLDKMLEKDEKAYQSLMSRSRWDGLVWKQFDNRLYHKGKRTLSDRYIDYLENMLKLGRNYAAMRAVESEIKAINVQLGYMARLKGFLLFRLAAALRMRMAENMISLILRDLDQWEIEFRRILEGYNNFPGVDDLTQKQKDMRQKMLQAVSTVKVQDAFDAFFGNRLRCELTLKDWKEMSKDHFREAEFLPKKNVIPDGIISALAYVKRNAIPFANVVGHVFSLPDEEFELLLGQLDGKQKDLLDLKWHHLTPQVSKAFESVRLPSYQTLSTFFTLRKEGYYHSKHVKYSVLSKLFQWSVREYFTDHEYRYPYPSNTVVANSEGEVMLNSKYITEVKAKQIKGQKVDTTSFEEWLKLTGGRSSTVHVDDKGKTVVDLHEDNFPSGTVYFETVEIMAAKDSAMRTRLMRAMAETMDGTSSCGFGYVSQNIRDVVQKEFPKLSDRVRDFAQAVLDKKVEEYLAKYATIAKPKDEPHPDRKIPTLEEIASGKKDYNPRLYYIAPVECNILLKFLFEGWAINVKSANNVTIDRNGPVLAPKKMGKGDFAREVNIRFTQSMNRKYEENEKYCVRSADVRMFDWSVAKLIVPVLQNFFSHMSFQTSNVSAPDALDMLVSMMDAFVNKNTTGFPDYVEKKEGEMVFKVVDHPRLPSGLWITSLVGTLVTDRLLQYGIYKSQSDVSDYNISGDNNIVRVKREDETKFFEALNSLGFKVEKDANVAFLGMERRKLPDGSNVWIFQWDRVAKMLCHAASSGSSMSDDMWVGDEITMLNTLLPEQKQLIAQFVVTIVKQLPKGDEEYKANVFRLINKIWCYIDCTGIFPFIKESDAERLNTRKSATGGLSPRESFAAWKKELQVGDKEQNEVKEIMKKTTEIQFGTYVKPVKGAITPPVISLAEATKSVLAEVKLERGKKKMQFDVLGGVNSFINDLAKGNISKKFRWLSKHADKNLVKRDFVLSPKNVEMLNVLNAPEHGRIHKLKHLIAVKGGHDKGISWNHVNQYWISWAQSRSQKGETIAKHLVGLYENVETAAANPKFFVKAEEDGSLHKWEEAQMHLNEMLGIFLDYYSKSLKALLEEERSA